MTSEQARQVLLRYRPGLVEPEEAEHTAALAMCEYDGELRNWFEAQSQTQAAIRRAFHEITPPAGLREQIVSEHRAAIRANWWRRPQLLAAAAMIMLVLAGSLMWSQWGGLRSNELSVAAFRTRMVKEALRVYRMEMESNDLEQVRSYLAQMGYPSDFVLPGPMATARVTGCLRTRWQNHNVAMICFVRDASAPPGAPNDMWFFIMEPVGVKDAPSALRLAKVNRLFTASWVQDGKLYLLGTEGDEAAVRKWL